MGAIVCSCKQVCSLSCFIELRQGFCQTPTDPRRHQRPSSRLANTQKDQPLSKKKKISKQLVGPATAKSIQTEEPVNRLQTKQLASPGRGSKNLRADRPNMNCESIELAGAISRRTRNKTNRWTSQEDDLLIKRVANYSKLGWRYIGIGIPNRSPKQCRERWYSKYDPRSRRDTQSGRETALMLAMGERLSYSAISRYLNRPELFVKNRCLSNQRKKNPCQVSLTDRQISQRLESLMQDEAGIIKADQERQSRSLSLRYKQTTGKGLMPIT